MFYIWNESALIMFIIATIKIEIDFLINKRAWDLFVAGEKENEADIIIKNVKSFYSDYQIEGYNVEDICDKIFSYKSYLMLIKNKWKNVLIIPPIVNDDIYPLLILVFYTHAVQRRMIQIHSSMIDYQGKGLLFLGPSGIGKTTMAELWNKYRNALIINGDMNFVQETEECFLGWGTPWHGSSPYCENANVPVCALIVLKQAQENSIRRLEGFEKVQLVSNNIIYPTWLENGMELCLETLDHLLSSLPVYELSCRPDEDAVRLTEKTIFN